MRGEGDTQTYKRRVGGEARENRRCARDEMGKRASYVAERTTLAYQINSKRGPTTRTFRLWHGLDGLGCGGHGAGGGVLAQGLLERVHGERVHREDVENRCRHGGVGLLVRVSEEVASW